MTSIGRIDYFDQLGTGVHDPATHTLEPRADSITAELAARPGTSAHMRMVLDDMDVRALLPTVRVPRLVLHHTDDAAAVTSVGSPCTSGRA
jgi:hypothetical protein